MRQIFIFSIFTILLVFCFNENMVFAENYEGNLIIKDDGGHALKIGENGEVRAASDLTFYFFNLKAPVSGSVSESEAEPDYRLAAYENWRGQECSPVFIRNGEYDFGVTEDTELRIAWLDMNTWERVRVPEIPEVFHIIYEEDSDLEAEYSFSYDKLYIIEDENCLSGRAPVLRIAPSKDGFTYLSVRDSEKEEIYEVKKEGCTYTFGEGSYYIRLWSEDSRGKRYFNKLSMDHFIYDITGPSIPEISLNSEYRLESPDSKTLLTTGYVEVRANASDAGVGVSHYIFRIDGIEPFEGESFRINADYSGHVRVQAVDFLGNVSEEACLKELLILDGTEPKLSNFSIREDKDRVYPYKTSLLLKFKAFDSLSGIDECSVNLGEKGIICKAFKGSKSSEEVECLIDTDLLKEGAMTVVVYLTDIAGNSSLVNFSLDYTPPDKKTEEKETSKEDKKETKKESEKKDKKNNKVKEDKKAPVLSIEGFRDFQVSKEPVRVVTKVSDENLDIDNTYVKIERRGKDGSLINERVLKPGSYLISEEGNYNVRFFAIDTYKNKTEILRCFTIDMSKPELASFKEFDQKRYKSFSFLSQLSDLVSDYSYVTSSLYLNEKEYDGREVTAPGRYVLKLVANDEVGNRAEEKAEFLIVGSNKNGSKGDSKAAGGSSGNDAAKTTGENSGNNAVKTSDGGSGNDTAKAASESSKDIGDLKEAGNLSGNESSPRALVPGGVSSPRAFGYSGVSGNTFGALDSDGGTISGNTSRLSDNFAIKSDVDLAMNMDIDMGFFSDLQAGSARIGYLSSVDMGEPVESYSDFPKTQGFFERIYEIMSSFTQPFVIQNEMEYYHL